MQKPRHVLMTTDTIGGVWTYAIELIRSLTRERVFITLFAQGRPLDPVQRKEVDELENCRVYECPCKLEWMPDPWDDVDHAGRILQELAREQEPDLIHFNDYSHAALSWNAPALVVAHSCVFSWFDAVKGNTPDDAWTEYWRRTAAALANANCVVAPSQMMLDAVNKHYGPINNGRVIYNARRATRYGMQQPKAPVVLCAGRLWDEAKNIRRLAQAAQDLKWPVRVAGASDHPAGGELVFEHVQMLGEISAGQLAEEMAMASIFAAPAFYEPFGLSTLEAALSGCALVLGDIPSLREVWEDAALYVRPDDSAAISEAINRLIISPELRRLYARRAQQRARRYGVRRQLNEYLKAYSQLLEPMKSEEGSLASLAQ